jgi:hypothetical protein
VNDYPINLEYQVSEDIVQIQKYNNIWSDIMNGNLEGFKNTISKKL